MHEKQAVGRTQQRPDSTGFHRPLDLLKTYGVRKRIRPRTGAHQTVHGSKRAEFFPEVMHNGAHIGALARHHTETSFLGALVKI